LFERVRRRKDEKMREKTLVLISLMLMLVVFAIVSMPVKAQDEVRFYVYNPASGTDVYPFKAYPAVSYVEVWVESPAAWDNTPMGIVGYTLSLQVDPAVVEVMGAQKYPDTDFSGMSDGFLGQFLENYGYNWEGYDTAFLTGTMDKAAGTISGTAEAILGFSTLGLGAGGGPAPLMRFVIRTKSGVTTGYSPITLFDCQYTTPDGTNWNTQIVDGGHYGTPPAPEFPLGIGLIMAMAPAIPLAYLWRTRKRRR